MLKKRCSRAVGICLILTALCFVLIKMPMTCFAEEQKSIWLNQANTEYELTYDGNEFVVSTVGTLHLHAVCVADGKELNSGVIWLSSAPNIASVDKSGLVSGRKVGQAEISCLSLDGKTTYIKTTIEVVAGVEKAFLTESRLTLLLGADKENATAVLSFVTEPENAYFHGATWTSTDENVATVDTDGNVSAKGVGTCTISAVSEDSGFSKPITCEVNVLQAVSQINIISKDIIWTGSDQKIVPEVFPRSASVQDVIWESSDPAVAKVAANGNVKGVSVGTATIRCISTDGSGVFGECTVRVEARAQKIEFNEKTVHLLIGAGEAHSDMVLAILTTPTDAYYQTATWESSDESVVTVDAYGKLHAVGEGSAQITAISDDPDFKATARCKVTVSKAVEEISLEETEKTAYTSTTVKLGATVEPNDATSKKLVWESSDPTVATVDATGNVRCISVGTCDIICTAADGSGVTSKCRFTVLAKVSGLSLSEKNVTLLIGAGDEKLSKRLFCTIEPADAFCQTVTWETSNENVVCVDQDGMLHAAGIGEATISAFSEDPDYRTPATCRVVVDQAVMVLVLNEHDTSIYTGDSLILSANISPDAATNKRIIWESSNSDVARVDSNGKVTGVSVGSADIVCTAADGSEIADKCTISVRARVRSVELDQSKLELVIGADEAAATGHIDYSLQPEDASVKTVTWTSSDENVATVDAFGTVHAIGTGTAIVSAVSDDPDCKVSATCQVVVGKAVTSINFIDATPVMNINSSQTIQTEVMPADATSKKLMWESSDPDIASVDANGTVHAVGNGTADIICTATDGSAVSQKIQITVITPVKKITPDQKEGFIRVGQTAALSLTVSPEDATSKEVEWKSDSSCVTVSADGVVTGVKTGSATITATAKDGSGASCTIKVIVEPSVPVELTNLQYGTSSWNYGTVYFTFTNMCNSVGVKEIVYTVRLSGTAFLLTKSQNTFTLTDMMVYPGQIILDSNYFPKFQDAKHITVTIETVTLSDGTIVNCGKSSSFDLS